MFKPILYWKTLLSLLFLSTFLVHSQNYRFQHFSVDDGLSDMDIYSIKQGHSGIAWITTSNGLNSFDGYEFNSFYPTSSNDNQIKHDFIYSHSIGISGNTLWLGTKKCFSEFDLRTRRFTHNFPVDSDIRANHSRRGYGIMEDQNGIVWIASDVGLYHYDPNKPGEYGLFYPKNTCVEDYRNGKEDAPCPTFKHIVQLENPNELLVSGDIGCYVFNKTSKHFSEISLPTKSKRTIGMRFIFKDTGGRIWSAIDDQLICLDKKTNSFKCSKIPVLGFNATCMTELSPSNFWVGTDNGGICVIQNDQLIQRISNIPGIETSLASNSISCLSATKDGAILIGHVDNGIDLYSPYKNLFNWHNQLLLGDKSSQKVNAIESHDDLLFVANRHSILVEDRKTGRRLTKVPLENVTSLYFHNDELWVGTPGKVHRIDSTFKTQKTYDLPATNKRHTIVSDIISDNKGRLWFATNCGILSFNNDSFSPHLFNNQCIRFHFLTYDKKRDLLWSGTLGYILSINPETKEIHQWTPEKGKLKEHYSYSDGSPYHDVTDLKVDDAGNLWVGCREEGLYKIQLDENNQTKFQFFDSKNGFSSKNPTGLLFDEYKTLWISTPNGLINFSPQTLKFQDYTIKNGLLTNDHNHHVYAQHQGELFFGTTKGIYSFYPKHIKTLNSSPALPSFTGFSINNRSVTPENDERFSSYINKMRVIEINHLDQILSFQFSGSNFSHPELVQYSYQMEGLNDKWISVGANSRNATYTNLPAGTYNLKIKASNWLGEFDDEHLSLQIIKHPPWWKSKIAYFGYLLLAIFAIVLFFRLRTKRLKNENTRLEKEVAERTAEIEMQAAELRELDKLKSRFFSNISHELRTPITLILVPIQQLMEKFQLKKNSQEERQQLSMVKKNGEHLLNLVNEILELSKLDSNKLELYLSDVHFAQFARKQFYSFEPMAVFKNVQLEFYSEISEDISIQIDTGKIEKVLNNLLSNALKYTESGEKVSMHISLEENTLHLKVEDTGKGIPPEDLPHVFERFFQSKDANRSTEGGSGIGLALSKELIQLMDGSISVDSKLHQGSTFSFEIPVQTSIDPISNPVMDLEEDVSIPDTVLSGDKRHILIVEDNFDMSHLIQSILKKEFTVTCKNNGQQALNYLSENSENIDLILSDVMMPVMDGFTLLSKIKQHDDYRGIPVIMLTAKVKLEDRLNALRIGVDDYLTKPFQADELLTRIKNLLVHRQLRKEWSKTQTELVESWENSTSQTSTITQEDQNWLIKIEDIVRSHCNNNNFTVDWLADEIAISPRQLQRRLQKTTGLTPKKYITEIRLQEARSLFESKKYNSISQVMYAVGFKKQAYFSKLFSQRFGRTPSQFIS